MHALQQALALAQRGFRVFPLIGKKPALAEWPQRASSDPLVVYDLFARRPRANVGIATAGLVVIDADTYRGATDSLAALGALPVTYTVRTARGGTHYYYRAPADAPYTIGANLLPGIDWRARGGYVVAAGSVTQDGAYTVEHDAPIAELPQHIRARLDAIQRAPNVPVSRDVACVLDTTLAISQARDYLRSAPSASEGNRAATAYRVACRLYDIGVSVDTCIDLMSDHWACDPPLSDDELAHQCVSAWDYRRAPPGIDNPTQGFDTSAQLDGFAARVWQATDAETQAASRIARPWIMARRLVRQVVSVMVSPGAVGKTTLSLQWACAIAGTPQIAESIGVAVRQHGPVLVLNLEDPLLEMQRRLAAITRYYGVSLDAMPHKVQLASGADDPLLFAHRVSTRRGAALIATELVDSVIAHCKAHRVACVIVDPLIEAHGGDENSNSEMRLVVSQFRRIAIEADCAVLLAHHSRKQGVESSGHAGNADSGRGASALINAARIAYTLYGMSKHDGERYGIAESERHLYLRIDDAKFNLGLASPHAEWRKRESVELDSGESVGVLTAVHLSEVRADETRVIAEAISAQLAASPRIPLAQMCDALMADPMLSGYTRVQMAKRVRELLQASSVHASGSKRVTITGSTLVDSVVSLVALS